MGQNPATNDEETAPAENGSGAETYLLVSLEFRFSSARPGPATRNPPVAWPYPTVGRGLSPTGFFQDVGHEARPTNPKANVTVRGRVHWDAVRTSAQHSANLSPAVAQASSLPPARKQAEMPALQRARFVGPVVDRAARPPAGPTGKKRRLLPFNRSSFSRSGENENDYENENDRRHASSLIAVNGVCTP